MAQNQADNAASNRGLTEIAEGEDRREKHVQTPACDRCTQGVMDATNPHLWGECGCDCHAENRIARVYCGCHIGTGMFADRDCSYEADVLLPADPVEDEFATFDCPECGAEGLLVIQHVV